MDTTQWKITQIISADSWVACYRDGSTETEERLSCWALVVDGERSFVTGVVLAGSTAGVSQFALAMPNFRKYRHLRGGE